MIVQCDLLSIKPLFENWNNPVLVCEDSGSLVFAPLFVVLLLFCFVFIPSLLGNSSQMAIGSMVPKTKISKKFTCYFV